MKTCVANYQVRSTHLDLILEPAHQNVYTAKVIDMRRFEELSCHLNQCHPRCSSAEKY